MPPDSEPIRLLLVCGTRPEAIKLAPLARLLATTDGVDARLCATGQHREMLHQAFSLFDLVPDFDLDIMRAGQDLADIVSAVMVGLRGVIEDWRPQRIIVHGDTSTTLAGTLAAYFHRVPVAHVEAGLRTGNLYSPWPEEGNRKLVGVIADRHYAPTAGARENLRREGVPDGRILVTGNTVIDALLAVVERLEREPVLRREAASDFGFLDESRRLVLVTGHRRENFGEGFENICRALARLARRDDVQIVYPVHLNPRVREPVSMILGGVDNVHLIEPLGYVSFVHLMSRSHIIITDSGGIQEEAPALGVPVLVMRDTTERPEAVEAGTVALVGTNLERIVTETNRLLDEPEHHARMSRAINPYGGGDACHTIVNDLVDMHSSGS